MFANENNGTRYIRQLMQYLEAKTNEGILYDELVKNMMCECWMKRAKAVEFVHDYLSTGFMVRDNDMVYWNGVKLNIKPTSNKEARSKIAKNQAKKEKDMEKYNKAKKESNSDISEDEELTEDEQKNIERMAKYEIYLQDCKKNNEAVTPYDEWLKQVYHTGVIIR